MALENLKGNSLAFLSIALWGMSFPITEILLEDWHPFLLSAARLFSASLCVFFILPFLKKWHELSQIPWGSVWVIGGLGVGIGTTLLVSGQQLSDPVTAVILMTMLPLISIALNWYMGGQVLNFWILIGASLAICGGILASPSFTDESIILAGGEPLILAATALYAWYSRCCQLKLVNISGYTTAAVTLGTGAIVASAFAVISVSLGLTPNKYDLSYSSLGLIVALGLGSAGISTCFWIISTRIIGVTLAAFYVNLAPFFVMVAGIGLGGEFSSVQFFAAFIVIAGCITAQYPELKKSS